MIRFLSCSADLQVGPHADVSEGHKFGLSDAGWLKHNPEAWIFIDADTQM